METVTIVQRLYADGRIENTRCEMDLAAMQAAVGGHIEMVRTWQAGYWLVVNEEGMLNDLPKNARATALVHPEVWVLDGIRGDALVMCEAAEDTEDPDPIP